MLSAVFSIRARKRKTSLGGLGSDMPAILSVVRISGIPVAGDATEGGVPRCRRRPLCNSAFARRSTALARLIGDFSVDARPIVPHSMLPARTMLPRGRSIRRCYFRREGERGGGCCYRRVRDRIGLRTDHDRPRLQPFPRPPLAAPRWNPARASRVWSRLRGRADGA